VNREDLELLRAQLSREKDGKVILVDPPAYAVKLLEDTCARTGLDWKLRHVYLIERSRKWRVELSIDGFRAIANMDESYNGQAGPFWTMGPDQPWSDIPPDKQPYASKVGVYRKGQSEPTWGVAKYKDYAAGPMWTKFPSTMIAKCAEMLGLRKALPGKLGGLYGAEEMAQADRSGGTVDKAPAAKADFESAGEHLLDEESRDPRTTETGFMSRIAAVKTKEDLGKIGQEIQTSSLGLEVKVRLSKVYGERKQQEGWK